EGAFRAKVSSDPASPTPLSGDAAELRRQLFQAGFTHPEAARYFTMAKIGLAILLVALVAAALVLIAPLSALPPEKKAIALVGAFLPGYFLPTIIVDRRRKAWKKRIAIALPDALDFML